MTGRIGLTAIWLAGPRDDRSGGGVWGLRGTGGIRALID
jgi:hypothetical protein